MGDGQFRCLNPKESGISVPGQGMALTVCDWNGDAAPDLLMSVNDDESQAWMNQSSPASTAHRFALLLESETGNQRAIGSRVTVIRKNDRQVHEITAGSGYLSQSTTQLFLVSDSTNPIISINIRWPDGNEQVFPLPDKLETILVVKKKKIANLQ